MAAGVLALTAVPVPEAEACTNLLVTRGASTDGSTMITYAADSHELYGELYYRPAATHPAGATKKIFEWDTGKYLGEIDQVARTYRVVGNMNEHQLVIAETTYGGRKELRNPKGIIDYGSLIYTTLQRAKTAREAIRTMVDLVNRYGYYSSGESFSIADPQEVWIMDLIGKGPGVKGALWVARRVPDGYVAAHANQPRIHQFPRDDPKNCLYAEDVVSFARKKGWYEGEDEDFSFAAVYAPADCITLRVCEGRVWSFFNRVAPGKVSVDYAACKPGAKPMPVWVKPARKLGPRDVMDLMRDHFEGTPFDLRKDVGAGPYKLPYRWRPLTWKVKGKKYLNERAIATQQTGFSFVSQSRAWLPGDIGGLLWFSVDDAASTVYVPMYAGLTKIPKPYAVGTASFERFSWESAFWVFNWVSNWAYTRYQDIIKDIRAVQVAFERRFITEQPVVDKKALTLHRQSPALATRFLNEYSARVSNEVVARWRRLGQELLMKYLDGNVRDAKGKVTHPGYPKDWYRRIVAERGEHYRVQKRKPADKASTPEHAGKQAPSAKEDKSGGAGATGSGGKSAKSSDALAAGSRVPARPRPTGCTGCHSTPATPGAPTPSPFPWPALLLAAWLILRRPG
jgi:dipeptidase